MKITLNGIALVMCLVVLMGSGSVFSNTRDERESGDQYADRKRQSDDENIKRAQGDETGRRTIHDQGPLQDDERGRW